jgi:hypothetical protein
VPASQNARTELDWTDRVCILNLNENFDVFYILNGGSNVRASPPGVPN